MPWSKEPKLFAEAAQDGGRISLPGWRDGKSHKIPTGAIREGDPGGDRGDARSRQLIEAITGTIASLFLAAALAALSIGAFQTWVWR
jgi:hypothetical protein